MCTATTYAYVVDGNVTPVTQLVPVETYLQYLENAAMPNLSEAYRTDGPRCVRCSSASTPSRRHREPRSRHRPSSSCEPFREGLDSVDDLPDRMFAVTIEGFMVRYSFNITRLALLHPRSAARRTRACRSPRTTLCIATPRAGDRRRRHRDGHPSGHPARAQVRLRGALGSPSGAAVGRACAPTGWTHVDVPDPGPPQAGTGSASARRRLGYRARDPERAARARDRWHRCRLQQRPRDAGEG